MKCVGRTETVYFPDFESGPDSAKIDTGAYGNALHVEDVYVQDGLLHFTIGGKQRVFEEYGTIVVKNSFGKRQKRYSIVTRMKMGKKTYRLHFSLTDRNKMKYPVLIGRRFIGRFGYMVDVRKKDINDKAQ